MMQFLKENWLWIALPFVAIVVGLGLLLLLGGDSGEDQPFIYNIW